MGNKSAKLTADKQWLEKNCPGAGQISANRWRNRKRLNCPAWEGKCSPSAVKSLKDVLQAELNAEINPKKKTKRLTEWQHLKAWMAENDKRTATREEKKKKKQNQTLGESKTCNSTPPPYVPTPGPSQPTTPSNPFTNVQNPYAPGPYSSSRRALNLMSKNYHREEEDLGKDPSYRDMGDSQTLQALQANIQC